MQRRVIQRKAAEGADATADAGGADAKGAEGADAAEGANEPDTVEPLPDDMKASMEKAFSVDFSEVRVHTGAQADAMAKKMGARAFTQGADIYFATGAYQPSGAGKELVAHELTHVVQQGMAPKKEEKKEEGEGKEGAGDDVTADMPKESAGADEAQTKLEVSEPGDAAEQEADAVGARVAAGGSARPKAAAGAELHRSAAPDPAKADKPGDKPAAPDAAAPGAAGDAKPAKKPPLPGATGILTGEATVKLKDVETKLPAGTVVKVVSATGDKIKVQVYSGHEGKEAELDLGLFKAEPGVAIDENTGKERDDVYKDFGKAALWGPDGPKPDDVKQGYIGDCFLMAAMGAVAAANPGALKALFTPQESGAPGYSISLHVRDPKTNKLVQQSVSVDAMMPALNKPDAPAADGAAGGPQLAYGGLENTAGTAKLWPSLIEKAYAQVGGGFGKIGEGGSPGTAMEALTGVESDTDLIPKKDQVIGQFQNYQKEGKAVVCATVGHKAHKMEKAFTEKDGEFSGQMTTSEGDHYCEIIHNTLEVRDDKSKHKFQAGDDGKGKLVSPDLDSSSVNYGDAKVSMKFKEDKKPDAADNLAAEYDYRGRISKDLDVFANHAYIFEKIDGENLIFKNPWGTWHPKPIPVDQFVALFSGINTDVVPKPEEGPPGG